MMKTPSTNRQIVFIFAVNILNNVCIFYHLYRIPSGTTMTWPKQAAINIKAHEWMRIRVFYLPNFITTTLPIISWDRNIKNDLSVMTHTAHEYKY